MISRRSHRLSFGPCFAGLLLVVHVLSYPSLVRAQIDATKLNKVSDRLKSVGELNESDTGRLRLWRDNLQKLTGEDVPAASFALFLVNMDALYKGNKIQPDRIKAFSDRTTQIPNQVVGEWETGLDSATKSETSRVNVAVLLSQTDRLFKKDGFDKSESAKLLKRLKSIPKQTLEQWGEVSDQKADAAAVSLVGLDVLFKEDALQKVAFEKLLKEVKPKPKL